MSLSEQQAARLVHDHILGITSPEDEAALQSWLSADKSHRRMYDSLMGRSDLVRRYRQYAAIDGERAWQTFSSRSRRARRMVLLRRVAAVAAVVVVLLGGVAVLWQSRHVPGSRHAVVVSHVRLAPAVSKARQSSMQSGRLQGIVVVGDKTYTVSSLEDYARILAEVPADAETTLATHDGKEYWLELSDGTQVHLDNHSSLKYPAQFADGHREVALRGTAWFKVAPGKSPFYVHTPDGIVIDRGTEFMVSTDADGGTTSVVLFEGKVDVRQGDGAEVSLKPGQKAGLSQRGVSVEAADLAVYRAWNEGEFLFHDVSLGEVMDLVGHWHDVEVEFASQSYSSMTFTGSIDRYGTLDGLLEAVHNVTGLPVHKEDNKVIIGQ